MGALDGKVAIITGATSGIGAHTAGAGGSVATVDAGRFRRTFDVHVGGVLLAMKHAAGVMLEQRSGSIVNVASITGRQGGWAGLDYSAAKAAVVQLTRCAAIELGEHGIRVNSISPGPIPTGIFAKGAGIDPAHADRTAGELEPAFLDALASYQPIQRVGSTEDVAQAAVWLASDAASFITGQDLAVDGGITAGRPASVAIAERSKLAAVFTTIAA